MAGDSVQKIKERLSIVDVISPYVELHKAGKNLKGKSPFTNEKTPSFYVSPDRGMYYCFSSSQGGDMFTFIEKMEGVDFKGALKILADKAGIELVPEDPKKRSERDIQYNVLEEATRYFMSELPSCKEAKQYLDKRGVKDETIAKWRIGYVPGPPKGGWRNTREYLLKKGFSDAQMLKAGLIKSTEAGKQPYDVFRDRIMFPICDSSGRVVGFSGRVLNKDSEAPKYVNSPETELFNKSEILFGYDKAKDGIRKFDFSLIVEGQFDVVLSHQAGYTNAVAVSGTALTAHHVGLLQRLSDRVVLALDADRAGISAVKRAADLMLSRGVDIKVARLPEGEDPADIVSKDPKKFKQMIGNATHVIEFLLTVLKEEVKDARAYKLKARDEVIPYLLKIDSHIDRDHFSSVIAEALNTTAEAIRLEVARLEAVEPHYNVKETDSKSVSDRDPGVVTGRKDNLIAFLAIAGDLISEDEYNPMSDTFLNITGISLGDVRKKMSMEQISELSFRLEQAWDSVSKKERLSELTEKLQELHVLSTKEKIAKSKQQLSEIEISGNDEGARQCIKKIRELQKELTNTDRFLHVFDGV